MIKKKTFVHVISPLHAGVGQGIGVIDLPIAREKSTNLPYLPGSSLKGALRDLFSDENVQKQLFGFAQTDSAAAGSIVVSDQSLLFLPVRSLKGTFAWLTSPFLLSRWARRTETELGELPANPASENDCYVAPECRLTISGNRVILEDLDLKSSISETIDPNLTNHLCESIFSEEKWKIFFRERICIVHDDVFSYLSETATEITARNSLDDDTKVTKKGALWYEESLPSETILSGVLLQTKGDESYLGTLAEVLEGPIQLGGNQTIGKGVCQIRITI